MKELSIPALNLAEWIQFQEANGAFKRATSVEAVELEVQAVTTVGDPSILGRFGDLGLSAGESFQYFGRAPLGEPIYICVRETVLALRLEEAALIFIAEPA